MQTLGVDDEQDHDETPRDDLEENENEFKIRIRIKLAKFRYIPNIPPPPRSNLSDVPVDKGDVHEVQDEEAEDGVPSAAEGQEAAGRGADHRLLPWYDQDQIHQNSGAPVTLYRFAGLRIKYSGDLK